MRALIALLLAFAALSSAQAEESKHSTAIEAIIMQPEAHWRFFTDQVMGGESSGQVTLIENPDQSFARMSGRVSTANRGGFIQMRLELQSPPPENTNGVRLLVRGNDQRYFVHLRTSGTLLPWQYYQAGFEVTPSWAEIHLPFEAFVASGSLLRSVPRPGTLRSVAVVAFGRDHDAHIDVQDMNFY